MKNFEKYKNQNDLINAFFKNRSPSSISVAIVEEFVKWREMEAEDEKILPCPFCGGEMGVIAYHEAQKEWVSCICGYSSKIMNEGCSIAAHNRVARAVMEAEKKGDK